MIYFHMDDVIPIFDIIRFDSGRRIFEILDKSRMGWIWIFWLVWVSFRFVVWMELSFIKSSLWFESKRENDQKVSWWQKNYEYH